MTTNDGGIVIDQLSESEKDDLTAALNALDEFRLLSGDVIERMEDLDRYVLYHRFYFPGENVYLHIEGSGVGNDVKYREENGGIVFDPRFIQSYVDEARQNGFANHVIMFNPMQGTYVSKSIRDIYDIFHNNISIYNTSSNKWRYIYYPETGDEIEGFNTRDLVLSAIASMDYFDKWSIFNKFYSYDPSIIQGIQTVRNFYENPTNNRYLISQFIANLGFFIGQQKDDFIHNDYGYLASVKLAFDCESQIEELNKNEAMYEEYKDKLWNVLEHIPNLSLSGNYISGTIVASGDANISITQMSEMITDYAEQQTVQPSENPTPSTPEQPEAKPEENNSIPPQPQQPTITPSTEPTENKDNKDSTTKILIVICVILGIILLSLIVLYIVKSRQIKLQSSNIVGTPSTT